MAAAAGISAGAVIIIAIAFFFIYGAIMVYWFIPAATEAISDRFFDRWEQSPLFQKTINNGGF